MKRLAWILALLMIFTACAQSAQEEDTVLLYYPLRTLQFGYDKTIFAEVPVERGTSTPEQLLRQYMGRWSDEAYRNPFPAGTTLIMLDIDGESATVTLSESFAQLAGLELAVACTALAKTLDSLTDVSTVTLVAEGKLLEGKPSITIDLDALTQTN